MSHMLTMRDAVVDVEKLVDDLMELRGKDELLKRIEFLTIPSNPRGQAVYEAIGRLLEKYGNCEFCAPIIGLLIHADKAMSKEEYDEQGWRIR